MEAPLSIVFQDDRGIVGDVECVSSDIETMTLEELHALKVSCCPHPFHSYDIFYNGKYGDTLVKNDAWKQSVRTLKNAQVILLSLKPAVLSKPVEGNTRYLHSISLSISFALSNLVLCSLSYL